MSTSINTAENNTIIIMQDKIADNLQQPKELEMLYQQNKTVFKKAFENIYENINQFTVAQIWNERLHYENEEVSLGNKKELLFIFIASIIAALIVKFPDYTSIKPEIFFPRNLSFIAFPALAAYFGWKNNISNRSWVILSLIFICSVFYINLLPNNTKSDTLILACIHLPFFLWAIVGITFTGNKLSNFQKRLEFLKYNGDLIVMTTVILIAGGLLTGITLGLFELIDLKIQEFYFKNIVICGLAASPIIATYLVQTNPQLVGKVSPIIAKIFTPLVLITLVTYLIAVIVSRKNPYDNRDFLMIFNFLLIGVMALILFSLSISSKKAFHQYNTLLLFALAIITIIVNGIALSAIMFRISEWGFTPNRLSILGGNILILINLLIVAFKLFKTIKNKAAIEEVEKSIAMFLPFYVAWTIIVTFLFPFIFQFK